MVAWIARWFRDKGIRVCIVSRGYRADDDGANDEARELEQLLPDVPHLQNPNRVAAARVAVEELATEVILLDDGFQHRQIRRDLDIVLLDATSPTGYEHVFPRGLLREPLSGLRRADVIGLTRAGMVEAPVRQSTSDRIRSLNHRATWIELDHVPLDVFDRLNVSHSLDTISEKSCLAFCGIGNPAGFRHTLSLAGVKICDLRTFPDHHLYTGDDLNGLTQWAATKREADCILCTHKDLVKIGVDRIGTLPLFALRVQNRPTRGKEKLEQHLREIKEKVRSSD